MTRGMREGLAGALVLVAAALIAPAGASATETIADCTQGELRAAIDRADPGETVEFACDGAIFLNDPSQTFEIFKELTLDAAGHEVTINGTGTARMFFLSGGGTVTMRGITLRAGRAQAGDSIGGGAVAVANATFRAEDMRFISNYAEDLGGAIGTFGAVGAVQIVDSTFRDNASACGSACQDGGGGAIALSGGRPSTIESSTFRDNSMIGRGGGGAILGKFTFNAGRAGSISIIDSTFAGNEASPSDDGDRPARGGGAVAAYNHPLSIDSSTFDGNQTTPLSFGFGGNGGAVQVNGDTSGPLGPQPASITDSVFTGNRSTGRSGDGGAISIGVHPTEISGVRILDSYAEGVGGGILEFGTLTISDSLLRGNVAGGDVNGAGGGIFAGGRITVSGTDIVGSEPDGCDRFESNGETLGEIVDAGDNFESPENSCGFAAITRPSLSVDDIDLHEPAAGETARAPFTVSLSKPLSYPLDVAYATIDGTATAGQDYVASSGLVTIPAGSTTAQTFVEALSDEAEDPGETFSLDLSLPEPSRAEINDGTGTATIVEPPPVVPPTVDPPSPVPAGPPTGRLTVRQTKLRRQVRVIFECDQPCEATLELFRGRRSLHKASESAAGPGDPEDVQLRLKKEDLRRLRRKVEDRGSVKLRVLGEFSDADGSTSGQLAFELSK